MTFKAGCFFIMFVVGSIAFPLNEVEDTSIFLDNLVDPLIVGGVRAAEPVPYMVALSVGSFFKIHVCGGSIISPRHVLTAAHCINSVEDEDVLIKSLRANVGSNRRYTGSMEYSFTHGVNHPDYGYGYQNDIGIFVTASAIVFTENVQPIVLNYDFIGGGAQAIVHGWGRLFDGGPFPRNLMELHPVTVDGPRCVSEVARVAALTDSGEATVDPELELCAFLKINAGMCHGDSGSALVLEENKQQIGVVAWGLPCALGAPDMFTRISAYQSWIQQQLL